MYSKSLVKTFVSHAILRILIVQIQSTFAESEIAVPSEKSEISGPGIDPSLVLPVRYFFIQAVDSSGVKLNSSCGHDAFEFLVEGISKRCPVLKELLDRKDGTYIARYRLYEPCEGLRISVRIKNGRHIAQSPYTFKSKVLHHDCECSVGIAEWLTGARCPSSFPQIDRDLLEFSGTPLYNISSVFSTLSSRYHPQSASFCHYVIKKQKLHRKCFGEHVGFAMFSDQILLFLLRRTKIPDVEFIINLGDYPLVPKNSGKPHKVPIFSWCGSEDSFDIVMPTYDITESSLQAMDRVLLDMLSVQATQTPIWKEKIAKAFWRGRDARRERLRLIEISRNHSDLVDAGLTNFFFFLDEEAVYGPKVPHADFFQFFKFKYQINLDGTVAAYRFPYLLAGDSVVLKQESPYYEHFYNDLQPWKHYIPVRRDLDDLVEKITWAKNHDEESWLISKTGSAYARENLLPHNIFCYYTILLQKWSTMVIQAGAIPVGYELIQQAKPPLNCDCDNEINGNPKDEL